MAEFEWRRGAMVGAVMSVVLAAASSGWSNDQPWVSIEVLVVGLICTALALLLVRATRRPAR